MTSGYQSLLNTLVGSGDPSTTPVATLAGATADTCIKRFESLAVQARLPLLRSPRLQCSATDMMFDSPRSWSSALCRC